MVYTEARNIKGKRYYYRVMSVRKKDKILKKRVYLGNNLSDSELARKEGVADEKLLAVRKEKANREILKIKPKIVEVLKKYNVKKAGIFGSYARGENKKGSDVDILVKTPHGMALEFVGMALELEKTLKKKVDLVSYKYIHPYLKKRILEGEVRII